MPLGIGATFSFLVNIIARNHLVETLWAVLRHRTIFSYAGLVYPFVGAYTQKLGAGVPQSEMRTHVHCLLGPWTACPPERPGNKMAET